MRRNYTKEVVVFTDEPEEFVQQLFYDYIKQLPQTMEGLQLKGGIAFIEEVGCRLHLHVHKSFFDVLS